MAGPELAAASTPAQASVPPRSVGWTSTDALLAVMVFFWGINFIVVKAAFAVFSPLGFNAVRFSLAAATIALVAALAGARRPAAALFPRLALLGVIGNTFYQLCFIEGLARTRAGNAALIMAAIPVQTAVASHLVGHERLRARDVLGLGFSTAGIATIVLGGGAAVGFGETLTGDLLMLLGTVCWSAYTIGAKPMVDALGPIAATAGTMVLGAIPLVLVCLPAALAQDWDAVTPTAWGAVLFSAWGPLVVAYLIWYRGVQRLGSARTAMYSNFTPIVAVLAAWPLLGETPTLWQFLGGAGIFAGIGLTRT
jgi:drug/metabolite transporter (DMT)-like permease